MSIEAVPPKYAQVVSALQQRIEGGTYPPGSMLPSEAQLIQEFGVSRPTVVTALRVLRDQGWVESRQGKGRFVLGRPLLDALEQPRPVQAYLRVPETETTGEVVTLATEPAVNRVAALLGVKVRSKVFLRRRVISNEGEPSEIVSLWLRPDLAEGTDLTNTSALGQGVVQHLQARKDIRCDHVLEYVVARMPTPEETSTLHMPKGTPVLGLYAAVRDASGTPLAVLDVALPSDRHELEDAYPIG